MFSSKTEKTAYIIVWLATDKEFSTQLIIITQSKKAIPQIDEINLLKT